MRVDGNPLNVIGRIAIEYYTFGINLLQDSNGEKVDVIEEDHIHKGAKAIARAILKKWLQDGGPTCTYLYLIDCLRESQLGVLADEMSRQLQRKESHERVSYCRICSL